MCDCCSGDKGAKLNALVSQISSRELKAGIKAMQLGIAALGEKEGEAFIACGLSLAILDEMLHLKLHEEQDDHHAHSHDHDHDHGHSH